MDIVQAIALAILQGLTEFLPISSSAHLILLPVLLGWEDQGLAFDVAVHVGTLSAVVLYYRRDLAQLIVAWGCSISGKGFNDDAKLAWYVGFGTIPVGLVGISLSDTMQETLRSPIIIAIATLVFAALLWWAEKRAKDRVILKLVSDALQFISINQSIICIVYVYKNEKYSSFINRHFC